MIKRRTSTRRLLAPRPNKAEDPERKLYYVARIDSGVWPSRPGEEDAIRGLEKAQQKADRLNDALTEEERRTVRYVPREYDGPRIVPPRKVRPKYHT